MTTTLDLQRRLLALGYDPGQLDGIPGRRTMAAVKAFQEARGLDPDGIVGPKTLAEFNEAGGVAHPPLAAGIEPPWITLARHKLGLNEKANNKTLRDWLASDGHTLGDPAKLPWCGDFVETCIALTLPAEVLPDNPYYALNWTGFGVAVHGLVPLGALAPFQRPGGGHIAFVVGHDADAYHCLGGNQSNAISIVRIAKERLSGPLRWPKTYPLPTASLPETTIDATLSVNEA